MLKNDIKNKSKKKRSVGLNRRRDSEGWNETENYVNWGGWILQAFWYHNVYGWRRGGRNKTKTAGEREKSGNFFPQRYGRKNNICGAKLVTFNECHRGK